MMSKVYRLNIKYAKVVQNQPSWHAAVWWAVTWLSCTRTCEHLLGDVIAKYREDVIA